MPHDVYFANQDDASDSHGHGYDGQVHLGELPTQHADVLPGQDVSPEETGQRGAERRAEGAVVDAERHAVHRAPEHPVADRHVAAIADFCPRLDHAREQDRGADVGAGELMSGGRDG